MDRLDGTIELVEHTADWALKVRGPSLASLFVSAALGLAELLAPGQADAEHDVCATIQVEALDVESLLVDWLSELALLAELESLVFRSYSVNSISSGKLSITCAGLVVDQLEKHVKAVTYHDLQIVATQDGLEATVVFDV